MVGDLKIEAVGYSETFLSLCQTTRCSKVDRTIIYGTYSDAVSVFDVGDISGVELQTSN
jgi:hypothetical protein